MKSAPYTFFTSLKLDCPDSLNSDCPDNAKVKPQHGFTLLEVIIAIAIFSILALGANALLVNVTDSNELSSERAKKLENLQRAMIIMERDFLQMQNRSPRSFDDTDNLVIKGGEFEFESDAYGVGFVRGGWQNPQLRLKRSHLQSVAYRLRENKLERLHTNYVDSVIGTEPKIRVLLEGVTNFKVEVLTDITTEFKWSETIVNTNLPAAIAITIDTETFGEIHRVFKVAI